ncbi:hypothetical protein NQ315_011156 [Exocentrus adspersus]|uniref:Uncharacterized protein n=1 Tax=Exocentrus adspersus TaxID=1586481 RepID=A0AAV8VXC8_9CUCU|nr:hypothetical protein NQ315_011156 [Exocentrus adspersus]
MSITNSKMRIFLPLPYSYITPDSNYSQKLLSGLGKPTKRGIKKCFNCGTYNGTRSTACKNKECGAVLKDSEEKSKVNLDAVKLLTGNERQVFSVRVRDMGPDCRGFVQLPLLQSHDEEDTNIFFRCHEENQNENNIFCVHINSALKSQSIASAVEIKSEVLKSLKVTDEIKQRLRLLAMDRDGPLVQRISKSVMAVKCQVSPKHPLGYLHFTFLRGKSKDVYDRYYCSCTEFMTSDGLKDKSYNVKYKCIHYFACIWALSSDSKYCEEFSHFLISRLASSKTIAANVVHNTSISHCHYKSKTAPTKNTTVRNIPSLSRNKEFQRRPMNLKRCKRLMPKVLPIEIKVLNDSRGIEKPVSWTFLDWISYVTESINKTMIFENCGILNTLVFYIPEEFYNCFKKRIPNVYQEIQHQESFNYSIMNILHLKEIFDTPLIKLKISKKFVHHEQKGYVEYNENEESDGYQYSFIFFLNVGQSTVDESDNTNNSFTIEWIPEVTSFTKVGQLKLQFENRLVILIRTAAHDPKKHAQDDVFKTGKMILDIAALEDEAVQIYGVTAIFDLSGIGVWHSRSLTPNVVKKAVFAWQNYHCRPKQLEFVNAPLYVNVVLNIFKSFMSEKLKKRVGVHYGGCESLHQVVDRRILPPEYGGEGESLESLVGYWSERLVTRRSWFIDDEQYKAE